MPAFRGHFSVQGSAVGGLSYKVKKAGKNYPGNFLKSSSKYSGSGAENSIYSPIRG